VQLSYYAKRLKKMKLKQLKQIIKEEIRTFYEAEGIITPEEVFSPEGQEEKNEWKIGDYTLHYNPESSSYAYEGGTVQLLDHRGEVVAKFGKDPSNDEDSITQLISAVEAIAQIRVTPEEEEELSPETLEEESSKSYLETLYRHLVNPKVEGKNKKQAWNLLKKAAEEENNALAKKLLQTYSQKYPSSSFF
jgi:anaerobic ribonucleoside-triphosphate reductase